MTYEAQDLLSAYGPDDTVAVGAGGARSLTDLLRDVAAAARGFPERARAGDEILVDCKDPYLFAVATLAAWETGHVAALPPNRRPQTLNELVASDVVREHVYDVDLKTGLDLREVLDRTPRIEDVTHPTPLDPARHVATVYTSGTTGAHRPDPKTARQLIGEARMLARVFEIDRSSCVLSTVPPIHIYGLLFGVLLPLCAGATIVRETPLHAETVAATIARHGADVLVSTPAHLRGFEVLEPGSLDALRLLFSSGAPLHASTATMLGQRHGGGVTEVLGSTETGGIAWRRNTGGDDPGAWQPFPGVRVAAGGDGRLLLDSPFLPVDEVVPRPCEDRVELLGVGTFRHLGRLDDVVKVAGKRLALGELERRLLVLPGVSDAAVVADASRDGRGTRVRAAAVAHGTTADALRTALQQWFDPVTLPRRIVLVGELPREESGKLARGRLVQLLDAAGAAAAGDDRHLEFGACEQIDGTRDGLDVREVDVRVPRELFYFRGHFPGHPVLPGVAQLERVVLAQISALWPDLGAPRRVTRLKFKQPIEPGDNLRLRLEHDTDRSKVGFDLRRGDEVCATGALLFA